MSSYERFDRPRILSLMPTFQCTAACDHCGTFSNPRQTAFLPQEHLLDAIRQAASNGYLVAVFTGGEATLAFDSLLAGLSLARSLGLPTRLVTNAHWATEDRVRDTILDLIDAGLNEINFSTGEQHARFVPVNNVIRASCVAAELGLKVHIMVELIEPRTITKLTLESDASFIAARKKYPEGLLSVSESPWMPLTSSQVQDYEEGVRANRHNLSQRKGCDSVLNTTTVQADGTILACCGIGSRSIPELCLGSISEISLEEADDLASSDFLKRWIRLEGPEHILDWASRHDPSIIWEDMYGHTCQACKRLYSDQKVRKVIREHHAEKLADIALGEILRYGPALLQGLGVSGDVEQA